jgi:hypothetical protein
MLRDEICVCGHPLSLHKCYACNGKLPNPDPKKTELFGASARCSKRKKLLAPPDDAACPTMGVLMSHTDF